MIAANDTTAIFKLAMELKDQGITYDGIAARLNDEGYQTQSGAEWTSGSVSQLMIKNGVRKRSRPTAAAVEKKAVSRAVKRDGIYETVAAAIEILRMERLSESSRIRAALLLLRPEEADSDNGLL